MPIQRAKPRFTEVKNKIVASQITDNAIGSSQLDLTANYAFTGTVTGTTGMTLANSGGVDVAGAAEADFLNLPSGIKRIAINLYGVSGASTDTGALIRLGTSSGLTTSGYGSTSHWGGGGTNDASGMIIYGTHTSNSINGIVIINHIGSNIYVSSHSIRYNNSNGAFGGAYVALGGTLDRLRVQLSSGGNMDSGKINIMYEI